MKYFKVTIITLILLISPLNAINDKALAGATVASIALITMIINSESNCKSINYKNYEVNKKMLASPATAILNNKLNACLSKVVVFTGNVLNHKLFTLDITKGQTVNTTKVSNGYKIQIASTAVSAMEHISGEEPEPLFVNINKNGTVIKADKYLQKLIGKKLFDIVDKIILKEKTFSKEIIYTGSAGNELYFQYRTYHGNTLKWPFTINLVFDLNKSDIIQVEHYKIQIIEANNMQLIYKILAD